MKKRNLVSVLLGLVLAAAMVLTGCENPSGVTPPSAVDITVSDLDLTSHVPKPVANEDPANAVFSGSPAQYTGSIVWNNASDNPVSGNFEAGNVYKAVVTLTPNGGYTFNRVVANSFSYVDSTVTSVTNDVNSGVVTITFSAATDPKIVDDLGLTGYVTAPVRGAAPNIAAINAAQYTGSIVWEKFESGSTWTIVNDSDAFVASTVYRAVVTLTAKYGYTFSDVEANEFTYSGATTIENNAGSTEPDLTVTITFPITAAEGAANIVSDFNLAPYIPVPVTDGKPADALSGSPAQYTGNIVWAPAIENSKFAAEIAYTATVTLTAKEGFTFTGVAQNVFVYSGAEVTNAANSGTVTITFPATDKLPLQGTVSIDGNAYVDQTLEANITGLTGTGTATYVWKRGDTVGAVNTPIDGATNETYTLTAADLGKFIKVTVSYSDNSGNKTSAVVGPVRKAITINGINSYYNGKYAVVRSSSDTKPTGGDYLIGSAVSSGITGVQINSGSVTIPVYLVNVGEEEVMGDEIVNPYTGTDTGIKFYVLIKDSPIFGPADLMDNHGAYTVTGANFSSGSATGTATLPGTVLLITGFDFPQASLGIFPAGTSLEAALEDAAKEEPEIMVAGASSSDGHITVSENSTATVQFSDRHDHNADRWTDASEGEDAYDVFLVLGSENEPAAIYKATVTFDSENGINTVAKTDFKSLSMLFWGFWAGANYGEISGNFASAQFPLTPADTGAGYLAGNTARNAMALMSSSTDIEFNQAGFTINSFAELVAFENNGASAPAALQTALTEQAENVPLLGVFGVSGQGVYAFYIDEFSMDEFPTEP